MSFGIDDLTKQGRVYPDNGRGQPVLTASTESLDVPFWSDSPDSWDTVAIGGIKLPGVCVMTGKVVRRVDRKNSTGTNGSTVTYVGDDVAEFEITVRMWTEQHLSDFSTLINALKDLQSPDDANGLGTIATGASSKLVIKANDKRGYSKFPMAPIGVDHPTLTLYRIRTAHILEYSFPKAVGEASSGIYEVAIKCIEHISLNKGQTTTPRAAISIVKKFGDGAIGRLLAKPSVNNSANTTAASDVGR